MTEFEIQKELFAWFYKDFPQFRLPNSSSGGARSLLIHNLLNPKSSKEGAKLNRAGLCKGFPDMTLNVPSGKFSGLHLELKKDKGRLSKDQKQVMSVLAIIGYAVGWASSLDNAKDCISLYLSNPDKFINFTPAKPKEKEYGISVGRL